MFTVIIQFANGSKSERTFKTYSLAHMFCVVGISYSGNRVHRVEIEERGNDPRAIWDRTWDDYSKHMSLKR